MIRATPILLAIAGLLAAAPVLAEQTIELAEPARQASKPIEFEQGFEADLSLQGRWFFQDPRDSRQQSGSLSLAIEPEYYAQWDRGTVGLLITAFARADSGDTKRSHADLRELYVEWVGRKLELRLGVSGAYWGKTELVHLVDVINQDDALENLDGEDKLGQPMLRLLWSMGPGSLHLYALPWFRERSFAGIDGRLRPPLRVEDDEPVFESDDRQSHLDFAARYAGYFGPLDFGISHFAGTARDPGLQLEVTTDLLGQVEDMWLRPYYPLLRQTSLDAQLTLGGWLLKLEAVHRRTRQVTIDQDTGENSYADISYEAATGGFEYTLYGLFEGAVDVGLLMEYSWDERHDAADNPFEEELFVGTRIAANDVNSSTLLGGAVVDIDSQAVFMSVEASRRLSGSSTLSLELRAFSHIDADALLYPVARDDYLQLEYAYFF